MDYYSVLLGSPYRLTLGGGLTVIEGESSSYAGTYAELGIGQDLYVDNQHRLGFVANLSRAEVGRNVGGRFHGSSQINQTETSLRVNYEYRPIPDLGLGIFLGLGNSFVNSDALVRNDHIEVMEQRSLVTLTAGATLSLYRGVLFMNGQYQFLPGYDFPFSAYRVGLGLDLAQAYRQLEGHFDHRPSIKEFLGSFQRPRGMIFSEAHFRANTADIAHHHSEARILLSHQSDAAYPLGGGINMGVGYSDGSEPGTETELDEQGLYFQIEEYFLNLRLPIADGLLLQGGRFYLAAQMLNLPGEVFFPSFIFEDHESPNNNHLTHSYQFHYGYPLTFGALRVQALLSPHVMITETSLHDWNELQGNSSHLGLHSALSANFDRFAISLSHLYDRSQDSHSHTFNLQALYCYPASRNCSLTSSFSTLNLGASLLYGFEERGHWFSATAYARYNFNTALAVSVRADVFVDPNQVRVSSHTHPGQELDLVGLTATVQWHPWMKSSAGQINEALRLKLELREDFSSFPFLGDTSLSQNHETRVSAGAAFVF